MQVSDPRNEVARPPRRFLIPSRNCRFACCNANFTQPPDGPQAGSVFFTRTVGNVASKACRQAREVGVVELKSWLSLTRVAIEARMVSEDFRWSNCEPVKTGKALLSEARAVLHRT